MTRALIIINALLIVGCDAHYGVDRQANVERFIDHKCIYKSLNSIQEITDIKYQFMGTSRPSKTSSLDEKNEAHRYTYKAHGIDAYVYLLTTYQSESKFTQASKTNHTVPPQANIDKIRLIMDNIEIAIAHYCEIKNYTTLVSESCYKVECK